MLRLLVCVYPLLLVPFFLDSTGYFRYSVVLLVWPIFSAILIITVSSRMVKESLVYITEGEETVVVMPISPNMFIQFPTEYGLDY
jgi:hypothetical protein